MRNVNGFSSSAVKCKEDKNELLNIITMNHEGYYGNLKLINIPFTQLSLKPSGNCLLNAQKSFIIRSLQISRIQILHDAKKCAKNFNYSCNLKKIIFTIPNHSTARPFTFQSHLTTCLPINFKLAYFIIIWKVGMLLMQAYILFFYQPYTK